MTYKGIIIQESLLNLAVLREMSIVATKVEEVNERHHTPWLKQWTLHTVEIPEADVERIANLLRDSLETEHTAWYSDFKNEEYHYIIFAGKSFLVSRQKPEDYEEVKRYGVSLGIPDYQLDFSPHIP